MDVSVSLGLVPRSFRNPHDAIQIGGEECRGLHGVLVGSAGSKPCRKPRRALLKRRRDNDTGVWIGMGDTIKFQDKSKHSSGACNEGVNTQLEVVV
jgi:hypothetical protein